MKPYTGLRILWWAGVIIEFIRSAVSIFVEFVNTDTLSVQKTVYLLSVIAVCVGLSVWRLIVNVKRYRSPEYREMKIKRENLKSGRERTKQENRIKKAELEARIQRRKEEGTYVDPYQNLQNDTNRSKYIKWTAGLTTLAAGWIGLGTIFELTKKYDKK